MEKATYSILKMQILLVYKTANTCLKLEINNFLIRLGQNEDPLLCIMGPTLHASALKRVEYSKKQKIIKILKT